MSQFDFSEAGDDSNEPFPDRLKQYDQWLVTSEKRPLVPSRGWQKLVNLLPFTEARDKAEQLDGTLAFCFTENGPFVGFDLDDVTCDNDFTEEALSLVEQLDTYTEVSSSGEGFHCIAEGVHLDERKTRDNLSEAGHLEVYDENRYFVLTGDVYEARETVERRPSVVRAVQDEYLPESSSNDSTGTQKPLSEQDFTGESPDTTPKQVRRTIETYVEYNDVDEAVLRLWQGSDEGYSSPSEADMAFVSHLYFWCKGDARLMDKCFRDSNRMRPKWDEKRGNQTYGEMTVRKACRENSETFGGKYID